MIKRLAKLGLILLLILVFTGSVFATWDKIMDRVLYFGTTDALITMSWDPVAEATGYEVELFHIEQNTKMLPYGTSNHTSGTNLTFKLPKTGHYIFKVRSCINNFAECGDEWSESIDSTKAIVDGENKAWWVYGYVAKPGDITIGR
jgi:hypothetical protein